MRTNDKHQVIISETDMINLMYQGRRPSSIVVDDDSWVAQFIQSARLFDIDPQLRYEVEDPTVTPSDYISNCVSEDGWIMPDEFKAFDIESHLHELCTTQDQHDRVDLELTEYKKRNMIPVLKFLRYFIFMMRKNKLVWGVGRGSSVASYILYLLGVHRVDSLKYELDLKEFLK